MKAPPMFLCLMATCCLLCLGTARMYAQGPKPADFKAAVQAIHKLSGAESTEWMQRSIRRNQELMLLADKLSQLGFKPEWSERDLYGERVDFEKHLRTFGAGIVVQNHSKPCSNDVAALGAVWFASNERTNQYNFCLIATNGDLKRVKEFTVNSTGDVAETRSWWTCLRSKLGTLGGACASAASTCLPSSMTVPAYSACFSAPCGVAVIMASSCCACNCTLWCKNVCGCCRQ